MINYKDENERIGMNSEFMKLKNKNGEVYIQIKNITSIDFCDKAKKIVISTNNVNGDKIITTDDEESYIGIKEHIVNEIKNYEFEMTRGRE